MALLKLLRLSIVALVQDISNTLWAFAALRHHPGAELMEQAASQAIMTIQRFKPQELANTLWSFAMLDHDPSTPMLDTMAIQMVAIIQGFRPQVPLHAAHPLRLYFPITYTRFSFAWTDIIQTTSVTPC